MFEFILLAIFASGCALMIWALSAVQEKSIFFRANRYRDGFHKLIEEIELLVIRANSMQSLANQTRDVTLLDHYHAALRMIETLMTAVKNLRTFGEDVDSLSASLFLTKDIHARLVKIETAMANGLRGMPHDFMKLAPVMAQAAIGCHFCSRPFDAALFGKVRVKVDGHTEEVAACVYCRERLLNTRKARVLFFDEDGVQVHWSKARSWTPSPEYWDINRDDLGHRSKTPHLELVYSSVSKINDTLDGKKD